MKNVGITSAFTRTKYTWTANYYVGPNHLGTSSGKRNLVDTTLLLTPDSKFNLYLNGDYGRDNNAIEDPDIAEWYAASLSRPTCR